MSLLRDRDWDLKYVADDGSLVRRFYIPALQAAQRYDRLTGYFSANALAVAARGVEHLIVDPRGRMRLIVGCTLGEFEVEAIERGESLRDAIERTLLTLPDLSGTPSETEALELLAWMIAHNKLAVKVAIRCDDDRRPVRGTAIFHEKSGIIEDKTGDRIAFTGSANETRQGWLENEEGISVYTSWVEAARVQAEEERFAKLWADKAQRVITRDIPTALRERLLEFAPANDELPKRLKDIVRPAVPNPVRPVPHIEPDEPSLPETPTPSQDERRKAVWHKIATAALEPIGGDRVGEATSAIVPWPHQVRAFHRMYDNWPPKLLIADEVGLGKTIQAGLLLRQAWLAGRIRRVLVLAPKAVCRQWQIELREKFNLDWPIYDGRDLIWPVSAARPSRFERPVSRGDWHREPFVIMSSHLARRSDRQPELLDEAPSWDLIVLDEAHHARRKAAGSAQEGGPNRLLSLMRRLKTKTEGLILLTATPMQVAPVELWDLLDLLGLPPEWHKDAFLGFFRDLEAPAVANEKLERLAQLFRASEAFHGAIAREEAERLTGLSRLQARKVLDALRDASRIPRRQLGEAQRKAAVRLIRQASPVKMLVSRHTRSLLRRYHAEGKLSTPIATRHVEDRFISLSAEEADLYQRVERYIGSTYNAASAQERNAVGFVMTIYRRRLASSFYALRRTLENRKGELGDDYAGQQELALEEDIADAVEAGAELDLDIVLEERRLALAAEETSSIEELVEAISRLPTDTKAQHLIRELKDLNAAGYRQCIVFTQFTDTLDFLRQEIVTSSDFRPMCFSGRGGERLGADGQWRLVGREEIKRRFREGEADLLICTDAAAEGLNFQFCGALINYDLPWNPMRVEQRIGRIDRLGQKFADIRIVNLHYSDTVEADVYLALRRRIGLFEQVVGGLQPILTTLAERIESVVLAGDVGERSVLENLEHDIGAAGGQTLDLDELAEGNLDLPPRPAPALTLGDLRAVLDDERLMPPGLEARPLDGKDYRLTSGEFEQAIRVTVDRELYEDHSDNIEFWTPGNPTFPRLAHDIPGLRRQ